MQKQWRRFPCELCRSTSTAVASPPNCRRSGRRDPSSQSSQECQPIRLLNLVFLQATRATANFFLYFPHCQLRQVINRDLTHSLCHRIAVRVVFISSRI